MDSYNFMTPIDENTTKYYWFQMRNFAPDDAKISAEFATSVRGAFDEGSRRSDCSSQGHGQYAHAEPDLKIDARPMRFRLGSGQTDRGRAGTESS